MANLGTPMCQNVSFCIYVVAFEISSKSPVARAHKVKLYTHQHLAPPRVVKYLTCPK